MEDFSLAEAQTQPNGDDMVITYTLTLRGAAEGHPIPSAPVRVMTVWQTVKNGWVEIAQSWMPVQ